MFIIKCAKEFTVFCLSADCRFMFIAFKDGTVRVCICCVFNNFLLHFFQVRKVPLPDDKNLADLLHPEQDEDGETHFAGISSV